jgi:hypothetical protein
LVGSEFSRAISLKRETFQSGTAQIVPLSGQLTRDGLGQFKCDVHKMKCWKAADLQKAQVCATPDT